MRYENESNFVELVCGMSNDHADPNVAAWHVETDLGVLPGELWGQVRVGDSEGFEKLKEAMSSWAEANDYGLVPSKSI